MMCLRMESGSFYDAVALLMALNINSSLTLVFAVSISFGDYHFSGAD